MKRKILWLVFSFLIPISLILVSCGTKQTTTTTPTTIITTKPIATSATTPVTTPTTSPTTTTGKWWDKFGTPQYGDTITIRKPGDPGRWEGYFSGGYPLFQAWLETLANHSWTLDRNIWGGNIIYTPADYMQGVLAESWEQPDIQTVIFHIRKGVHWQNIPPVNGRELTAADIEYHFQRILGLGSGFTKPSPFQSTTECRNVQSVTAIDKYTVVFKWKTASLDNLEALLDPARTKSIVAREAVEKWGDVNDWKRAIGTGPFILTDYVSGSSLTLVKNPDYRGYDERYPNNKLPYVNGVKVLIIPDLATSLAGVRTGKLDMYGDRDAYLNFEQSESLVKTNPKLTVLTFPLDGQALSFRIDTKPFSDIRVRTALQMAVDLPTIAKTLYGGVVDGKPFGIVGPSAKGYYTPFDSWPKELQEEYTYNPTGAKTLLTQAGFPNGFKTSVLAASSYDMDLLQTLKGYFGSVGVDMEIRVMESSALTSFLLAGKLEAMSAGIKTAAAMAPTRGLQWNLSTYTANYFKINDPVYDDLFNRISSTLDQAERKKLILEADMYCIRQHWAVNVLPRVGFTVVQPWYKGYSDEFENIWGFYLSRTWIDQNIKKAMGH